MVKAMMFLFLAASSLIGATATSETATYGNTLAVGSSVGYLNSGNTVDVFEYNQYDTIVPTEYADTEYIEISGGGTHMCGLRRADHGIDCWGDISTYASYNHGQLNAPEGETWKSVSAGRHFNTCGIKHDDTVECWGNNNNGQRNAPSGTFSKISAGHQSVCAIAISGSVQCWGLISNTIDGSFTEISMGNDHGCALESSGQIQCFGGPNNFEQNDVPTISGSFIDVFVGSYHSCGIKDDNTIICWGRNDHGQIDNDQSIQYLEGSAGHDASCGILADSKQVDCWSTTRTCDAVIEQPDDLQAKDQTGYESVISAGSEVCVLQDSGDIDCFGDSGNSEYLTYKPDGYTFTDISTRGLHACGLTDNKEVVCWDNGKYQNGQSDVPNGYTFTAVSAGRHSTTCAIKESDSNILCWGNNLQGQANAPSGVFSKVSVGNTFACGINSLGISCWGQSNTGQTGVFLNLDLGNNHACALRDDGAIICWGFSISYGQTTVPQGYTWIDVFVGSYHSCGITTENKIVCWGRDDVGQIQAPSDVEFVAGAAGHDPSCGVRKDNNKILCWSEDRTVPLCISQPENAVAQVPGDVVSDSSGETTTIEVADSLSGWSATVNNDCPEGSVVGGYGYTGTVISKEFTAPSDKCDLTVSLDYWQMFTWDNELAEVIVNGQTIWSQTINHDAVSTSVCGYSWSSIIPVSGTVTLDSATFSIEAKAHLNTPGSDESFGISNVNLVYTCTGAIVVTNPTASPTAPTYCTTFTCPSSMKHKDGYEMIVGSSEDVCCDVRMCNNYLCADEDGTHITSASSTPGYTFATCCTCSYGSKLFYGAVAIGDYIVNGATGDGTPTMSITLPIPSDINVESLVWYQGNESGDYQSSDEESKWDVQEVNSCKKHYTYTKTIPTFFGDGAKWTIENNAIYATITMKGSKQVTETFGSYTETYTRTVSHAIGVKVGLATTSSVTSTFYIKKTVVGGFFFVTGIVDNFASDGSEVTMLLTLKTPDCVQESAHLVKGGDYVVADATSVEFAAAYLDDNDLCAQEVTFIFKPKACFEEEQKFELSFTTRTGDTFAVTMDVMIECTSFLDDLPILATLTFHASDETLDTEKSTFHLGEEVYALLDTNTIVPLSNIEIEKVTLVQTGYSGADETTALKPVESTDYRYTDVYPAPNMGPDTAMMMWDLESTHFTVSSSGTVAKTTVEFRVTYESGFSFRRSLEVDTKFSELNRRTLDAESKTSELRLAVDTRRALTISPGYNDPELEETEYGRDDESLGEFTILGDEATVGEMQEVDSSPRNFANYLLAGVFVAFGLTSYQYFQIKKEESQALLSMYVMEEDLF